MNKVLLALVSVSFAFTAYAGGIQNLNFEDLKVACQNPAKFQNQTAPTNIQVTCKDVQLRWVADSDKTLSLGTARHVTIAVQSDKYAVDAVDSALVSSPQLVACGQYKQVAETVETVRAITCGEIIEYSGSGADFCAETVNSLKAANPAAPVVEATGRTFSLCASEGSSDSKSDQR